MKRERKTFYDKSRLMELMTTKTVLQKILERILPTDKKDKHTVVKLYERMNYPTQ